MNKKAKRKKTNHSRYFRELDANEHNKVVRFDQLDTVERAIREVLTYRDDFGYIVIDGFRLSEPITKRLTASNDLPLLLSKNKVLEIARTHNEIVPSTYIEALEKASSKPDAIAYDAHKKRYQFYVRTTLKSGRRLVFELNTIPGGIKNVEAHVWTALFTQHGIENRIKNIANKTYENLYPLFDTDRGWYDQNIPKIKKGEGVGGLSTLSPTGTTAVPAATREDLSSSEITIVNETIDVKRS